MTLAAFLRNYRRILALLIASALLHLLALLLIADVPLTPTPGGNPPRLVIAARLMPSAPKADPQAPMAAQPSANAPSAAPSKGLPGAQPGKSAGPPAVRGTGTADAFAVQVDAASMIAQASELPGSQNTRLPASAMIRYVVEKRPAGSGGWTRAGSAALTWKRSRDAYTLEALSMPAGASTPSHTMTSEGIIGDAGILPARARDTGANGTRETVFDREKDRISFNGTARTAPLGPASQDQLSMLMQLASVANADAAQLEGAVDLHVGGAGSAGVVRFELVGVERIDTPMGELETLHLAQKADAGRSRIDIWLATQHDYLPVRLATRRDDGSEVQQTAASITR